MEEHIKQIEAAIAANLEIKERTGWLDSCCGHLRTAVERAKDHVAALSKSGKRESGKAETGPTEMADGKSQMAKGKG